MLTPEDHLERRKAVADARLEVAEALSWFIAFLAGWGVLLKWDSWWLAAIAWLASFFFVTHSYRKEAEKAWKAYTEYTETPPYDSQ